MSTTLTENVVLVRTRSHDLNSVKKLNCWGCTLKDVSIVRRMPNVEVISLSINLIDTLEHFGSCTMLQELYLRKNEIKDINEILYLSQLQFLKKLSLEDNPCTNTENYRLTVLKALPNLEILDNIRVIPEEIYQAEKLARDLVWPGTESDLAEDIDEEELQQYNNGGNNQSQQSHHDSHQSLTNFASNGGAIVGYNGLAQESYSAQSSEDIAQLAPSYRSTPTQQQPSQHRNSAAYSNGKETPKNKTNMAKSNSLSDYNIYNNGHYRASSSPPPPPPSSSNNYELSEYCNYEAQNSSSSNNQLYATGSNHPNGSARNSVSSSQQRLLPKGGKNRNANILSAVLCLIKELDYGSLEVVDTTIHCRMEEMED